MCAPPSRLCILHCLALDAIVRIAPVGHAKDIELTSCTRILSFDESVPEVIRSVTCQLLERLCILLLSRRRIADAFVEAVRGASAVRVVGVVGRRW